jgi:hypothetical protein
MIRAQLLCLLKIQLQYILLINLYTLFILGVKLENFDGMRARRMLCEER